MEEVSTPPAAFRVLFSDGDRDIDRGEVVIDPGVTLRGLQTLVGDLIGVSSHQIKLYLLRQKKAPSGRSPPEFRRKTPIGEGTDFAAVARQKGYAVLAQVKGTRKDRRGRGCRERGGGGGGEGDGYFPPEKKRAHLPEKAVLRRPVDVHAGAPAVSTAPVARENGAGLMGLFHYENLRELQRQRERYLLATAAAAYCRYGARPYGYDADGFGSGCALSDAEAGAAVCEVCLAAAGGMSVPFHWCVRDRVVAEGFRSSAGPIQRPLKGRVQVSA